MSRRGNEEKHGGRWQDGRVAVQYSDPLPSRRSLHPACSAREMIRGVAAARQPVGWATRRVTPRTSRKFCAMAAKTVLVPIGQGSEEMEAVSIPSMPSPAKCWRQRGGRQGWRQRQCVGSASLLLLHAIACLSDQSIGGLCC